MEPKTEGLNLNLGCGAWKMEGFVNVDREALCEPDVVWDLERSPWPFEDGCAAQIVMSHVLEHLGQDPQVYLGIIRELYRVARPGGHIYLMVPHPRHDSFITDPTHVRAITPDGMRMFSRRLNEGWVAKESTNTPLGLYLDVDFEVIQVKNYYDEHWVRELTEGRIEETALESLARSQYNVIRETAIVLQAIKPAR